MNFSAQDFTVTAAGRRLAARWLLPSGLAAEEATAGAVLVFLHQGLGSIGGWREFPARLAAAAGLPALVYDRWGYGGSEPLTLPRADDYLRQEAEETLPQLLGACGIARPVLYGHSDGGSIALLYAAAFPSMPLAVIAEAAHVFVEPETLTGIRAAAAPEMRARIVAALRGFHGEKAETLFRAWAETWLRPSFAAWRMDGRLPAIPCPLLAIQGAADEYGTRAQVEAIAAGVSGPAEILWLEGCGHSPHREREQEVLAASSAFLARQGLARSPAEPAESR
ncbi:MAG: alpha/beta fold hydrolase [Kiloniellales bacterium]